MYSLLLQQLLTIKQNDSRKTNKKFDPAQYCEPLTTHLHTGVIV